MIEKPMAAASHDPRVDAYIAKAAPFAQPILTRLRSAVHAACPDVQEGIKWGMPFFMLRGRNLAFMAGFKQHCGFGFWRSHEAAGSKAGEAMGQFGRLTAVGDLPAARELETLIQRAAAHAARDALQPAAAKKSRRPPPQPPADLAAALARNAEARAVFEAFPPGKQREYVEWITEAKREDTRTRRLLQAVEWLAEGKSLHWRHASR